MEYLASKCSLTAAVPWEHVFTVLCTTTSPPLLCKHLQLIYRPSVCLSRANYPSSMPSSSGFSLGFGSVWFLEQTNCICCFSSVKRVTSTICNLPQLTESVCSGICGFDKHLPKVSQCYLFQRESCLPRTYGTE